MSATFTASLTITRVANPGDAKSSWAPRVYSVALPGLTDDEIQFPVPASAVDLALMLPSTGTPQLILLRTDQPLTYKRNSETVANNLGTNGFAIVVGAPSAGVPITQLLVSNPGSVAATLYVLIAGV